MAAMRSSRNQGSDATGLPRGASRLELHSCEREPPRRKAVASKRDFLSWRVADIVKTPRDKPVASISKETINLRLES